jgi:hypothetical protein
MRSPSHGGLIVVPNATTIVHRELIISLAATALQAMLIASAKTSSQRTFR